MANKPMLSVLFLFLETLVIATLNFSFCSGSSYVGCIENERQALLRLKQDLTDPSSRLASWIGDGDCCTWNAVVCNNLSGHILELHLGNPFNLPTYQSEIEAYERSKLSGKINPSLSDFKHLIYLDLSRNNFEGVQIPGFLGAMRNLRYLDLSRAGFVGMIPPQLGNLSSLQYLSLDQTYYGNLNVANLYVENLWWLSGLPLLRHLNLGGVDLSKASNHWLSVMNLLPSLVVIRLSHCQLNHLPPLPVANFSSLYTLDLSNNQFDNSQFPSWVFGLGNLETLDLSADNFQTPIPNELQNLASLRYLSLNDNNFNSPIPNWIYRCSHLEYLSLSHSGLHGAISDALGNLTSIRVLGLSNNELVGKIPKSLGGLCNLVTLDISSVKLSQEISEVIDILSRCISDRLTKLDLSNSQLSGHLTNHLGQFRSLDSLDLRDNSISGTIPTSLGELRLLRILDLSSNKLEGTLTHIHFANLTGLSSFSASGNSLKLKVNLDWVPPFQLSTLKLGSCLLGPKFPPWLYSQKQLNYLDLSNSGIIDAISEKFWKFLFQLDYINLSGNQIHGNIPNLTSEVAINSLEFK